jgi:hypothetical protein
MRYLSKKYVERMHNSSMESGLCPDPRAERLDEVFYEEVLAGKQWGLVEILRKVYATPQEEVIESIIKSRQHAAEVGLITQEEADAGMARVKAQHVEYPPFNEDEIIRNFKNSLVEMEDKYRKSLPEEILCRVADLRMLALGFATPEVIEAITAWSDENRRFVEDISRASNEMTKEAQATLPWRTARLFYLHDAHVERAERNEETLTLHIDEEGVNRYHVQSVRFIGCKIVQWEDPSGLYWFAHETERLPDGCYSVGVLLRKEYDIVEMALIARDILIDSPTTEEDMRAEDERIRRRIERNANRTPEGKA